MASIGTLDRRSSGRRAFWQGFAEGIKLAFIATIITALVVAFIAWQTFLPSVGFLWLVGAL